MASPHSRRTVTARSASCANAEAADAADVFADFFSSSAARVVLPRARAAASAAAGAPRATSAAINFAGRSARAIFGTRARASASRFSESQSSSAAAATVCANRRGGKRALRAKDAGAPSAGAPASRR